MQCHPLLGALRVSIYLFSLGIYLQDANDGKAVWFPREFPSLVL